MMSHTRNKSYNLVNQEETKALARQIKSVLNRKGYTISTPLLIDALNASTVNKIHYLDQSHEIDFTTVNLLKSLDCDSIVAYLLLQIYPLDHYDIIKNLLSVIISAHVWLRDNNNEPFNFSILRRGFILDVIEKELITHKKLPQYIINNIISYLDNTKRRFHPHTIDKEGMLEAHGYLQLNLSRSFQFIGENCSQLNHNESVYNDIKLLSYDMGIYLKGQEKNIKHSDLIEAIVIALGYKNHHVYSAEYKTINKSYLYKDKIKTVDCLFEKGMSSQIMNAITDYMPINKNNIRGLYLIRAITKILVHIRETENTPITFENIIVLLELDIDKLFQIINKYKSLTGLNKYPYELSSPFDVGGNYKIFSAERCFELYAEHLRNNDNKHSGICEADFKEQHAYITEELKKALILLKNNGIK